jgi:hypothetical protein
VRFDALEHAVGPDVFHDQELLGFRGIELTAGKARFEFRQPILELLHR